jgi:cobalt/nickel transport system ATP-binding protein
MDALANQPPHHLSFDQRRRAAVATVFAMEPEILVLDEPTSNLDPAARRELAEVLHSLDLTTLIVTHDCPTRPTYPQPIGSPPFRWSPHA